MLRREILKKEFFGLLNKSYQSLKLVESLKVRNSFHKNVYGVYSVFKNKKEMDETEMNNFVYEGLKINRKIELYLDENGRDTSGKIELKKRVPTYENYKKLEVKEKIFLGNYLK